MAKIVYRQRPAPGELSQQIFTPRAKARVQKPQGGGKCLVQIPGGAWGMVMDEIDTCINQVTRLPKQTPKRPNSLPKVSKETSALRVICLANHNLIALISS